jgi:hypothetical protein
VRLRAGGGAAVLVGDLGDDLAAQNRDVARGLDAEPYAAAVAGEHDDGDPALDHDRVAGASSEDEHAGARCTKLAGAQGPSGGSRHERRCLGAAGLRPRTATGSVSRDPVAVRSHPALGAGPIQDRMPPPPPPLPQVPNVMVCVTAASPATLAEIEAVVSQALKYCQFAAALPSVPVVGAAVNCEMLPPDTDQVTATSGRGVPHASVTSTVTVRCSRSTLSTEAAEIAEKAMVAGTLAVQLATAVAVKLTDRSPLEAWSVFAPAVPSVHDPTVAMPSLVVVGRRPGHRPAAPGDGERHVGRGDHVAERVAHPHGRRNGQGSARRARLAVAEMATIAAAAPGVTVIVMTPREIPLVLVSS